MLYNILWLCRVILILCVFQCILCHLQINNLRRLKRQPNNQNECTINAEGSSGGSFSTPGYPSNYPPNSRCELEIVAPRGHSIKVTFDVFDLGPQENCKYDWATVTQNGERAVLFCGRTTDVLMIESKSDQLKINFQTDSQNEYKGFFASYQFKRLSHDGYETQSTNRNQNTNQGSQGHQPSNNYQGAQGHQPSNNYQGAQGHQPSNNYQGGQGHQLRNNQGAQGHQLSNNNQGAQGRRSSNDNRQTNSGTNCNRHSNSGTHQLRPNNNKNVNSQQVVPNRNPNNNNNNNNNNNKRENQNNSDKNNSNQGSQSSTGFPPRVCGKNAVDTNEGSSQQSSRIVGGSKTEKGEHPWQAMLWEPDNKAFCGGTILSDRWVISAAHCFDPKLTSHIKWKRVWVRLGKFNQLKKEEDEFNSQIENIYQHPDYSGETFDSDLSLLKLKKPVRFSPTIKPICLADPRFVEQLFERVDNLPNTNGNNKGPLGVVTGWGKLAEKGSAPKVLQEIQIPMISRSSCKGSGSKQVTKNMFCAGYDEDHVGDACQGDSGGPFMVQERNTWYLIGVVSWGIGCGRGGQYGFYTKVNNFHQWINEIIKSESS